jgi:ribonucleoside-diphosphate reductase alpha chain
LTVRAVEDAGLCELYDVEVEGSHEYVVNGIISHNTINLHREATPDDVERAYMLAWTKGCKGITVYRDGCREGQVLTAGAAPVAKPTMTEAEANEVLQTAIEAVQRNAGTAIVPAIKRRVPNDGRREGVTLSKSTPYGTVHMTVNNHPDDGDPFELFVRVGKSGSEVMAWAEAFGRVVSYTLALPSPFSPKVRLEEVARQLHNIGGGDVWNVGMERVVSAPDAISKLLLGHLGVDDGGHYQPATVTVSSEAAPFPVGAPSVMAFSTNTRARSKSLSDLCPSCGKATFIYQQRCGLCTSCGHSKC